jgi:hypothetical protein
MSIPTLHIRNSAIVFACLFLFCGKILAAPANDNFANATIIPGFPASASGDTTGSTAEPGEPAAGLPPRNSIWWQWTAPFARRIAIIDDGSVVAAWLKVFSGNDLTSLTNLISNGIHALNVLNVTSGTTYHIAVDINGPPESAGPIHFRLVNLATNDNFADALPLTGEMLETFGDNSLATFEPDEPDYSAGWQNNSIWWKWAAPRSGSFRVSVVGSAFAAYFYVFTGDSLTNLSLATTGGPFGDGPFDAVAGEVYSIRVVGGGFGSGLARVAIYPSPPPNDSFEQRTVLSGAPLNVMGTSVGATSQTNEPVVFWIPGGHSVWYQWQATAFGTLNISATNLTGHPLLHASASVFSPEPISRISIPNLAVSMGPAFSSPTDKHTSLESTVTKAIFASLLISTPSMCLPMTTLPTASSSAALSFSPPTILLVQLSSVASANLSPVWQKRPYGMNGPLRSADTPERWQCQTVLFPSSLSIKESLWPLSSASQLPPKIILRRILFVLSRPSPVHLTCSQLMASIPPEAPLPSELT